MLLFHAFDHHLVAINSYDECNAAFLDERVVGRSRFPILTSNKNSTLGRSRVDLFQYPAGLTRQSIHVVLTLRDGR